MANILIRNIDRRIVERLKRRARRNRRSLNAELQTIVERAALSDMIEGRSLAARIRRKLSDRTHGDSALLVADDRRR